MGSYEECLGAGVCSYSAAIAVDLGAAMELLGRSPRLFTLTVPSLRLICFFLSKRELLLGHGGGRERPLC